MTKKSPYGTISTIANASRNTSGFTKASNVTYKVQALLKAGKLRLTAHANQRMTERKVIYYELLQALSRCKHESAKDRFSDLHKAWRYSLIGNTLDDRTLRIGVSFETDDKTGDILFIVTVIDIT